MRVYLIVYIDADLAKVNRVGLFTASALELTRMRTEIPADLFWVDADNYEQGKAFLKHYYNQYVPGLAAKFPID